MPHLTQASPAATLAAAGSMTLLMLQEATAQERTTLGTIGAGRMARFEQVSRANPELRPAPVAPAHDLNTGRSETTR